MDNGVARVRLLAALVFALVLAGLTTLGGGFLLLAVPLLCYLAVGFWRKPDPPTLRLKRTLGTERIAHAQEVSVRLEVVNEGAALEQLFIEDLLPAGLTPVAGETRLLTPLPAGERVTLDYTLRGERGYYTFPGVRLSASDHLVLFQQVVTLPAPGKLFVTPEVLPLKRINIRPRQTRVYAGQVPARQGGPGVEFFGLREYQPGDPRRFINARASARQRDALIVNEFEQERAADIGLVLDVRLSSTVVAGRTTLFEHATAAVATLADAFISHGDRVGLLMYGAHIDFTYPGYGKVQRERLLESLARAAPSDRFDDMAIPTRLFAPRTQLVMVSPLLPEDAVALRRLRARGYPLLVFSPDPVTFEHATMTDTATGTRTGKDRHETALALRLARLERALLLKQLSHAGVQVIDWPIDTPFQQVALAALSRLSLWARPAP